MLETNGNANRFLRLAPPSTGGPCCTLRQPLLYDVIPDRGRLYRPPSLLSEGIKTRMCIASFTPLSNHLCSTASIFVFSNVMVWSGLSVCMCFETSDVVELGPHMYLHTPHRLSCTLGPQLCSSPLGLSGGLTAVQSVRRLEIRWYSISPKSSL